MWLYENRATITKEHGLVGKRVAEVTQKAGEVWKAMGPAEKKKHEDLAAKDKARYEEVVKTLGRRERNARDKDTEGRTSKKAKKDKEQPMSSYFPLQSGDPVYWQRRRARGSKKAKDMEGRTSKEAKKDKEAPKRAMSAYVLWTQENRQAIMQKYKIEKANPELMRKGTEEWKTVSEEVKKEYEAKAAKALDELYLKDLAW